MNLKCTKEAAAHITKSVSWLNKSRMTGNGPVYMKIGGAVRYDVADLDRWLAGNRRTAIYDHANDNQRAAA
jgi:predicted heme/steroid binding protein